MTTTKERGFNFARVKLEFITSRKKNPNVMAPEEERALREAIADAGFLQPVLLRRLSDGYEIIDGVHRVDAARALHMTEVPAIIVEADVPEAIALQIGMNKMRGRPDLKVTADLLCELSDAAWSPKDMTLTGYTELEVGDLMKAVRPVDAEDLPKGPVRGDDEEPKGGGDAPEQHVLEVAFGSRKEMQRARRLLKRLGGGDLGVGLLSLVDNHE